jgi:mRNA-degrading endonuclease toxin of MazEF toxin-antitoxin module
MFKPGEIYMALYANLPPHPVVIVSREDLNRGNKVVVVIITSAKFSVRSKLPNCVPMKAGQFGLIKDCVAQAETIFVAEIADLDTANGPVGKFDDATFRDVIKAIGYVIESDCESI